MRSSSNHTGRDAATRSHRPPAPGALFVVLTLAYLATVVTVAVLGRPMQWMAPALGVLPLIPGVLMVRILVRDLRDRVVLRRRGHTVTARFAGHSGKARRYTFTDARGAVREFRSRQHVAAQIEVTYDPHDPQRVVSPLPLLVRVLETGGMAVVTCVFLTAGVVLVPVQLVRVLVGR
ncbi:hypothetical protein AB0L35_10680 [Streptomyces sp. NPDC052309]|uniref:DUF3592 domain-containing protein n=1 Tax=Streptomyces griseicoloratus TaxID=2752516 RepID=A0A926L2Q8_9ACTN|nr:hypothetical protein [Streptomyces griseicoloratus]MBD0420314.1 hypothetical protein [Streptomyces griseicoloratus]